MNFHETALGRRFFEGQLPQLITALKEISAALNAPKPVMQMNTEYREDYLVQLYYTNFDPDTAPDRETHTWYLHYMVNKDAIPSGYQCAVRLSGAVELSPASFYSMLENKNASELLGVEVKSGEIVEIDDGLKPCCFYVKFGDSKYLPHWDAARARENQYRGGDDA